MKRSLTRKERLSNKREIAALFTQAKKIEGEGIKLYFLPNQREFNRILITVRRGFRTAVRRNRQKRILRDIYRNNKSIMKQGFDLGFVLIQEESSFQALQAGFFKLLDKTGLADDKKR